ncbi:MULTISPECIES: TadE family type IV pilus minor pilin [Streptomyces]|uniref:TadE family type IV pilus minor pilin n=1 Tax=Streptomyces TaxID=1883 RepID=UPI00224902C1|nr:TadE family type IV pilus minor pilin [Streptomyces sp. JHD 1]MCX2970538.1 pilus assembly protein [Streptomyces sp. JHD 1]
MRACEPRADDRGQASAELAAVVPTLALLVTVCVWGLLTVGAQIRCLDAARAGARAAARAEPLDAVLATARSAAPPAAAVSAEREGALVRVRVRAQSPGPGPLTLTVSGEAVAHAEEGGRGR